MNFTGKIIGVSRDYETSKPVLQLAVNESLYGIDDLKDKDLSIKITRKAKKRSLDANAYHWVLVTKIAERMHATINEVHNLMLARYGFPEMIDGKLAYFILPDNWDANKLEGVHLKATSKTQTLDNGVVHRVYIVLRGSHTYNTVEMNRLIEGDIDEAKRLGIETLTPAEKAAMMEAYEQVQEQKNRS